MAGLSIARRQKAWLRGVLYGASGRGKCIYTVPKLKEIFERGLAFGRANPDSPYARAIMDQAKRRTNKPIIRRRATTRMDRRGGSFFGPSR